ncbi:hypothetical protein R3P38DRAFT_3342921 [Favolaschia claudopus]|uniref:Vacuolar protein sorting-associated protein 13 second N-terminal domain-containing protein n=1 Tax=Favolaschia claudopus TaxID=2862362 RepID=A0AAW0DWU9_9AGAR
MPCNPTSELSRPALSKVETRIAAIADWRSDFSRRRSHFLDCFPSIRHDYTASVHVGVTRGKSEVLLHTMPSLSKIFRRHRTSSELVDVEAPAALVSAGPSEFSHLALDAPVPNIRYSASMPHLDLVLPQEGLLDNIPNGPNLGQGHEPEPAVEQPQASIPNGGGDDEAKSLPPTPTPTSPEDSPTRSEPLSDNLAEMWRNIDDRSANISKMERVVNKISHVAGAAFEVGETAGDVTGFIREGMENDEIKAIGNAILEGVPAIMSALETLAEIHPFLAAAYLPFKLIYYQETQRRDNDKKRTTLFAKIKDVMMILLELKSFKKNDTRTTPEGKPVLSRLASICEDMRKDIAECYNVLNVQEKRSVGIKFLKASTWNKELGKYAARFTNRREELTFALSLRSVITLEEMNNNMKTMMQMFSTILTSDERDMGRWIQLNGGERAVMRDDKKCAAMIKYEASLTASTGGSAANHERGRLGLTSEEDSKKTEKAIVNLRKEYREDVRGVIQENLGIYSKRFDMRLDDMGKDLGKKIQHQGDRLIMYLREGPHQRIKDKIVYHVWKDQGWRGSAKTRLLVLALRDYLVERVEHSKLASGIAWKIRPLSLAPTIISRKQEQYSEDDDDDPEADMSVPLPDSWMTAYLQVKRLRYLEQALDPNSSGFTSISEINAFSRARPINWSFPHWLSYWAIGWQIYATRYCVEIEEIFGQMNLLKQRISVKMPGNTVYVNEYIDGCWQHVTALTSSIERCGGPESWLDEKFTEYIEAQESVLKERLDKIQYNIDAEETVSLILRGDRIEASIFALLAILLRRHLAKMHLALKQELHDDELWDAMDTVTWVVNGVWVRFLELKEEFQHQQVADLKLIFESLSCGLFKNYYEWNDWINPEHFMEKDMTPWTSDTLTELNPSELVGILSYAEHTPRRPETDVIVIEPSSRKYGRRWGWKVNYSFHQQLHGGPKLRNQSPVPTVEAPTTNHVIAPSSVNLTEPSDAEMSITGRWFGWHRTENQTPYGAMTAMNFKCGDRLPQSESGTTISGHGTSAYGWDFTLTGTLNSFDQPEGMLGLVFELTFTDDDSDGALVQYTGTFFTDRDIIVGTFSRTIATGEFILKKVPESAIMCARPLVPRLNAKELWAFAIKAVLDDIKRRKPRLSYLCSRMIEMRRILWFIWRDDLGLLDGFEQAEYSQILKTLSYEQMVELYKLSDWYDHASDLQPDGYRCDNCGVDLVRSRVACLECVSSVDCERMVDFCSRLKCIAAEVPHRTDVHHDPKTHLIVRFRDHLLLKDYCEIKEQAGYSLRYARDWYETVKKEDRSLVVPLPPSPTSTSSSDESALNTRFARISTPEDAVVPVIVGDSLAPPAVNAERSLTPVQRPALNTSFVSTEQRPAASPALSSSSSWSWSSSSSASSSKSTNLLSTAVTPAEATMPMSCVVCRERIVAPAWYCITCPSTWVCDSCERVSDHMLPWDYVKRYRTEVAESGGHNVMHSLVRVTGFRAEDTETSKKTGGGATTQDTPWDIKWDEVEKRMQELVTARFEAVNTHVDERLDNVDRRLGELTTSLANIERLLMRSVHNSSSKS